MVGLRWILLGWPVAHCDKSPGWPERLTACDVQAARAGHDIYCGSVSAGPRWLHLCCTIGDRLVAVDVARSSDLFSPPSVHLEHGL